MQKITPFLWFDTEAEAAAKFYVSLFTDSRITSINRYTQAGPREEGLTMSVLFELNGQAFHALNGGPEFKFNPAVSFYVDCDTQAEIDHLWDKLMDGGKSLQCGWVTDKFGLTWQIVPSVLSKYMQDPDREKVRRVTEAFITMHKLEIEPITKAYEGR